MLINHYGLDVMDPQARTFLTRNMSAFLFKTGRGRRHRHEQTGNDLPLKHVQA